MKQTKQKKVLSINIFKKKLVDISYIATNLLERSNPDPQHR